MSVSRNRFVSYYGAKFEREARAKPIHWIIVPDGSWFELKQVGGFDEKPVAG